jgi:hypothetical protein
MRALGSCGKLIFIKNDETVYGNRGSEMSSVY